MDARLGTYYVCSAYELLHHRNVPIQALVPVLPDLAGVHPHILARVETDGSCFPSDLCRS